MASTQALRQASIRTLTGTAHSDSGDWDALFDLEGIADSAFNARQLAWINSRLGSSHTNLMSARQAFATAQGVTNWNALDDIPSADLRLSIDFVNERYTLWDGSNLVLQTFPSVNRNSKAWDFTAGHTLTEFQIDEMRSGVIDPATGGALGARFETSETNNIPYSADWTQAINASVTVTPETFGGNAGYAAHLEDQSAVAFGLVYRNWSSNLPAIGEKIWRRVFVKKTASNAMSALVRTSVLNAAPSIIVDVGLNTTTGTIVRSDATSEDRDVKLIMVGSEEYWQLTYSHTLTVTPTVFQAAFYPAADLENGAGRSASNIGAATLGPDTLTDRYPGSLIITQATVLTRDKDDTVETGLGAIYPASTAFSFLWDGRMPDVLPVAGEFPVLMTISDGSSTNRCRLYLNGSTGELTTELQTGGVQQCQLGLALPAAGTPIKVAVTVDTNDVNMAVNGSDAATDTSATLPSVALTDADFVQSHFSSDQGNTTCRKFISLTSAKNQAWREAVTS